MTSATAFSRVVSRRRDINAPRSALSLPGVGPFSRCLMSSRMFSSASSEELCKSSSAARNRTRLMQAKAAIRSPSILLMVLMEPSTARSIVGHAPAICGESHQAR
jgi:hypothetical protein